MIRAIALFLFLATIASSPAYDFITKNRLHWADGSIPMRLQLDETLSPQPLSDGKTSWNAVAQEALDIWNAQLSRVQFAASSSDADPGDGNDHNEVFFSSEVYGHQFGSRVLAITTAWRVGTERVEGDTVFNTEIDWDSYRGPIDFGLVDLRRVAAHEFGHTLGLSHPDQAGQVVVSIMNSVISDLDTIALDDIHGVRALYPANARYTLSVNVIPPGSGSVFAFPAPDLEGKYAAGTLVTLSAKPQRRFRFNFWGGDENLAAKKLRVIVVDNETITANFSTNGAPVILSQPRHQAASEFDTVAFVARVSSSSSVTYQWQHDGVDIPDTDAATLVLRLVGHQDSGLYSVRVTNARGETHSKPARLVVDGY
ncbi:MAG TPA: matrixin family metalloprotease [Verrucomicrobiae bacterium]|jgi:hypothetical protein